MSRLPRFSAWIVLLCLWCPSVWSQAREDKERDKYYQRWVDQDVVYIITDDERAVFKKLGTTEEKDAFIEEFWRRRASNPNRDWNEYKEEHYRRIAHANDKFSSGIPGWKTDRGRIYIMFGEPAEIEDHAGGEHYYRKPNEGGGRTTVYPFQVWRYRQIDGVGDDIEVEFVDQSWTGLYKMTMNPWDKDLLLHVDGEGQTIQERARLAQRAYRPGLHPGNLNDMTVMSRYGWHLKDTPFERMLQYFNLQRPPSIRQKELQSLVQARVTYNALPFHYALNYVYMDPDRVLVPITMEIENKNLSYNASGNSYRARVALYGVVSMLNGKIVAEFEDSIVSEYFAERFEFGKTQKSMYQRPLLLPTGLHKVDFVVKDLGTGHMGTLSTNLNVPKLQSQSLGASPIILAKVLQAMDTFPDAPTSFVLGDLKVVPNITRTFRPADHLNIYFQVYNAALDQAANKPSLVTQYSILQGEKVVSQLIDKAGTSLEYASQIRAVLARRIALKGLVPGRYRLKVEVQDTLSGQSVTREVGFEVIAP